MEYLKILGNVQKELNLTNEESATVESLFEMLSKNKIDIEKLQVTRKSNAYATIIVKGKEWDYDLIRFKMTDKTKWIAIPVSDADRLTFKEHPLFSAQTNKNQLHWKSKLNGIDDLSNYITLITNAYYQCLTMHNDNF